MKTAWSMTESHRDPHIVVKKILIFRFIARIKNSEHLKTITTRRILFTIKSLVWKKFYRNQHRNKAVIPQLIKFRTDIDQTIKLQTTVNEYSSLIYQLNWLKVVKYGHDRREAESSVCLFLCLEIFVPLENFSLI